MKKENSKRIHLLNAALIVLLAATVFYLFYNQAAVPNSSRLLFDFAKSTYNSIVKHPSAIGNSLDSIHSLFSSDLQQHLEAGINCESYSLAGFIFYIVYQVFHIETACIVALTAMLVLTVPATAYLTRFSFRKLGQKVDFFKCVPFAVSTLFICNMPVLAEGLPHLYRKSIVTQPWHNSTYICMRLAAVLAMTLYMHIEAHYLKGVSFKELAAFTVLLTLANFSKPNFFIAFAPMMLVFLIADFVKTRGKSLLRNIEFGVCVLLSMGILFFQANSLFPGDSDSGVMFSVASFVEKITDPVRVISLILGLLFPAAVSIVALRKKKWNDILSKAWVMFLISWLEYYFIVETGERAAHGNFGWGIVFASFFLYISAAITLANLYKTNIIKKKTYRAAQAIYIVSIACGICYYAIVLTGIHYFL